MKIKTNLLLIIFLLVALSIYARDYECKVIKVLDGDTVKAQIYMGFGMYMEESVRLYGINAPELSTGEPGKLSTEFLKQLVEGKSIMITTKYKKERDKYGRVLGVIYLNGVNINQKMVEEKMAIKYYE